MHLFLGKFFLQHLNPGVALVDLLSVSHVDRSAVSFFLKNNFLRLFVDRRMERNLKRLLLFLNTAGLPDLVCKRTFRKQLRVSARQEFRQGTIRLLSLQNHLLADHDARFVCW